MQDVAATLVVPLNSLIDLVCSPSEGLSAELCTEQCILLTAGNFNLRLPGDLEAKDLYSDLLRKLSVAICSYLTRLHIVRYIQDDFGVG